MDRRGSTDVDMNFSTLVRFFDKDKKKKKKYDESNNNGASSSNGVSHTANGNDITVNGSSVPTDLGNVETYKPKTLRLKKMFSESNDILGDVGEVDALSAEFRSRIGLLSEADEGLSDAFKAHLGLHGLDETTAQSADAETTEISLAPDWVKDATIAVFKYTKFAKENFQNGISHTFTSDALTEPLMKKEYEIDRLASLVCWIAIQRFMGDAPAALEGTTERSQLPIMTKIYRSIETQAHRMRKKDSIKPETVEAQTDKQKETEFEPFKMRKRSSVKKFLGMVTGGSQKEKNPKDRKKSKINQELYGCNDTVYCEDRESILAQLPGHELDIIHFIAGHGILRKDMRDEIMCQICKQISDNPNKQSIENGWVLMGYCLGCFLPTSAFLSTLKCFMKDAPLDFKDTYVAYAKKILRRTLVNGVRYHPPNWLEYQAVRLKKHVQVPVTFATGRTETLECDSATTAAEMCQSLACKLGLKDQFGFSIYIAIYDKVSSLGSGLDHVMDAISECEQVVRTQGIHEKEAPWGLFFRKELFSPWHDPVYDDVSTDLIYTQFRKGVRCKEYRIPSDEEMAELATKIYFVENNGVIIPGKLQQSLHHYLPSKYLTGDKTRDVWTATIISLVEKLKLESSKMSIQRIKEDLIMRAADKWTVQFSGLFEAFRISGPQLPRNDVVIAINHKNLDVMHEPFKICLSLPYYSIIEVCSSRTNKQRGQCFSISTVMGQEYSFMSPNAQNISMLVDSFLEGLRRRSKYAVGIGEFIVPGPGGGRFGFRQGDLLTLLETAPEGHMGGANQAQDWVFGVHEDSKTQGSFPLDMVYILPTMTKPDKQFLNYFASMSAKDTMTLPRRKGNVVLGTGTVRKHTKKGKETFA